MARLLSVVVFVGLGASFPARAGAEPSEPSRPSPSASAGAETPPSAIYARLSDEAELSRVAGLYEAGKYRDCSREIEQLLDPTGRTPLRQPAIVENARVYWAACLLGVGDGEAAEAPLRAAIHENPQMKPPDSLVFPQPVVERFLKVRDSLVSEIRAAEQTRIRQAQVEARRRQETLARDRDRMLALEKLARVETIIFKNQRWLALVPFGVGQFQNRQPGLGYALLAGETLLGALGIAAIAVQSRLATKADGVRRAGGTVNEDLLERNQRTWSVLKVGAPWALAVLVVGGIAQAQLEFVPEFREERPRPLPAQLSPAAPAKPPEVSLVPHFDASGGGLTLWGRF